MNPMAPPMPHGYPAGLRLVEVHPDEVLRGPPGLPPAYVHRSAEVGAANWVCAAVLVVVGAADVDGVDAEEATGVGVAEADSHEAEAAGGLGGRCLLPSQPYCVPGWAGRRLPYSSVSRTVGATAVSVGSCRLMSPVRDRGQHCEVVRITSFADYLPQVLRLARHQPLQLGRITSTQTSVSAPEQLGPVDPPVAAVADRRDQVIAPAAAQPAAAGVPPSLLPGVTWKFLQPAQDLLSSAAQQVARVPVHVRRELRQTLPRVERQMPPSDTVVNNVGHHAALATGCSTGR